MFFELKNKDSNYRKRYFDMLKYRLAYGSLELEGIEGDLADALQSMKIYNQLDAINYIFENSDDDEDLSPMQYLHLLCEVAEKATGPGVPMGNMPFKVTPDKVAAAIIVADKLGTYFKEHGCIPGDDDSCCCDCECDCCEC